MEKLRTQNRIEMRDMASADTAGRSRDSLVSGYQHFDHVCVCVVCVCVHTRVWVWARVAHVARVVRVVRVCVWDGAHVFGVRACACASAHFCTRRVCACMHVRLYVYVHVHP